jgi:hypothetical protein
MQRASLGFILAAGGADRLRRRLINSFFAGAVRC